MDLNLVRVFVTIYETGSLTAASERLFVTQSAVSQSLGRLRLELGDPLFERAGRGVEPTPVAVDVYPGFREALQRIDRAVDRAQPFDASTSERTFRIALSELGEIGWIPALIRNVRAAAPSVHVEVVPLVVERLPEWLSRGSIDLAISVADLPDPFERTLVKRQRYTVLMSPDHPLAGVQLTLAAYAAAPRAVVAGDSGATQLRLAEERAGVHTAPALAISHFATLPQLLTGDSPFIVAAPGTIAEEWAGSWGLQQAPLPFPMDPIELVLYRRQTSQHLGALDWFHQQVAREVTTSRGQFSTLRGESSG